MRSFAVLLLAAGSLLAADWKIAYEVPKTAKPAESVPLIITVTDAKNAPVEGADVKTVLSMVDMDHGEFEYTAKAVKPGVYQAEAKFIMAGAWQIEVRVNKDGETASKKFRHELAE